MDELIEALQNIGLNEKEAKVYLTLLQLGPSNPYQIAKQSGLKRPTAYVIAESLVEKNIIVQTPGEKYIYVARAPEHLFEEQEKKISETKKLLPEFRALKGGVADKPNVLYFEGTEGIKRALMYKIKEFHDTEIVGFYADPDFASKESTEAAREFNDYRLQHNIKMRGFLTESKSLKSFNEYIDFESLVPKFLPKEQYSSNASFEFYPTLIKIIFFDTSVGIVIESPTVAKAMRQMFELLWDKLGEEYKESKYIG